MSVSKKSVSLYIHYPFCVKKCSYCGFFSIESNQNKREEYFTSFTKEIDFYAKKYNEFKIHTIYLGGGSPGLMSDADLSELFNLLEKSFNLEDLQEFTMESNPININERRIKFLNNSIVSRLSIGIQSFQKEFLKLIGRNASVKKINSSLEAVRKYWKKDLSIDLIFAIPKQDIADLEIDLEKAVSIEPHHISAYSLTIEPNSELMRKGFSENNEKSADMLFFITEYLKKKGYNRYEISNYSLKDKESLHNLNYWNYGDYIGIGAGAVSKVNGMRFRNFENINYYTESLSNGVLPIERFERLDKAVQEFEYIFLGLRKAAGIDLKGFKKVFEYNFAEKYRTVINDLIVDDFCKLNDDRFWLNEKGLDIADSISELFISY